MIWLILAGLVWLSVAQLRDQLDLATGYGWSQFSFNVSVVLGIWLEQRQLHRACLYVKEQSSICCSLEV